MSKPTTILVLDSQPISGIKKIVESSKRLVVVTSDPELARHALTTMIVGVWVCDVLTPGVDLKSLIAIAENTSPGINILFIGTKPAALKANMFLTTGHGVGFMARPFSPSDLKKRVSECAVAYQNNPVKRGKTGLITESNGKRVLYVSNKLESHETSASGPDPEHYTLTELLGIGGTGTVFLARDKFLEIEVAIKVISPDVIADPDVLKSFKDEARIAMQLSHRNIVRIYNFTSYNDCYYIVMEYVRGQTLRDVIIDNESLSIVTVCRILLSCADALEYAHGHNVTHNDIKPENIFITEGGDVKIIDFGTATLKNRMKELTHIVGTPEYISPEQLRCEIAGPPTDIYALGIITYLMLMGRFPFPIDTTVEDLLGGVRPDFTSLPESLADVLGRATAYEPSFRYQSVTEFARELVRICGCEELCADINSPIEIVSSATPSEPSEEESEELEPSDGTMDSE